MIHDFIVEFVTILSDLLKMLFILLLYTNIIVIIINQQL